MWENIKSVAKYVTVFLVGLFGPVLFVKIAGWPIVLTIVSLFALAAVFLPSPPRSEEEGQAERRRAAGGTAAGASERRSFDLLRHAARFAARIYVGKKIAGGNEGIEFRRSRISFGRFLVKPKNLQQGRHFAVVPGTYEPIIIDPLRASDTSDEGWWTGTDALPSGIDAGLVEKIRRIKRQYGSRAIFLIPGTLELLCYVEVSDQSIKYKLQVTTERGLWVTLDVLMRAKVMREDDGSLPPARARLLVSHIDEKHEDYLETVLRSIFLTVMTGRTWEDKILFSIHILANAEAICKDAFPQLQTAANELGLEVVSLRILGATDVSGEVAAREAERLRIISGAFGGGGRRRATASAASVASEPRAGGRPASPTHSAEDETPEINWKVLAYSGLSSLMEWLRARSGGGGSGGSSS